MGKAGRGKSGRVLGWVESGQVDMCFSHDFLFLFLSLQRKQHVFVIWKFMPPIT